MLVVGGLLVGAALLATLLAGCSDKSSGSTVTGATALRTVVDTIEVVPPSTEIAATIAVTTVATTAVPTTLALPSTTTVESESARIAEAADASAAEYFEQTTSQKFDEKRLREFGTVRYVAKIKKLIDRFAQENRRYEAGSTNEYKNLSVGWASGDETAAVFTCYLNNDAEFDTKGTPEKSDDVLIQADMLVTAYQRSFTLEEGKWKEDTAKTGDLSFCSGAFG